MDRLSLIEPGAVDIEGTMARAMEGTGAVAPTHPQFRWARPDDVEGRIEIAAVDGHFSVFRLPV
jgi:hypothetical protein